jgi:myosin-3
MASVRAQPWVALEADNLTSLAELTEANLLKAIEERYRAGLIYTAVGDILVAVNPFQELLMYDGAWSGAYAATDVGGLAPHIYRVASAAYNSMVQGKKNQVCVISGESGAGKTESAKFIMKQVMKMCSSAGLGLKLQQKIIQLNPLLEAFGNARTELNDNSSRFGKFIQLLFESSGRIVGAGLEQYLLEKSRVCVQTEKERNFHIFYYLYAGLPQEKKAQLHLKGPEHHRYLRTYCQLTKDCSSEDSREAFSAVLESMESIGFTSSEVDQIITLLAAILHIGDIEFVSSEEGGGDSATVRNPELVETVSQLLCLESSAELSFALTTLRTVTRGEPVDKLYSCSKAAVVRDAAAKALYSRMFQWIVSRINTHLQPRDNNSRNKLSVMEDHLNIGILDIFGFENFEANSFEQFCINLANEQLQQYFNHQIFAMEKLECAKEGVDDLDISYTDNTPVIDLFLARPIGLLCLLDEQCKGLNVSCQPYNVSL